MKLPKKDSENYQILQGIDNLFTKHSVIEVNKLSDFCENHEMLKEYQYSKIVKCLNILLVHNYITKDCEKQLRSISNEPFPFSPRPRQPVMQVDICYYSKPHDISLYDLYKNQQWQKIVNSIKEWAMIILTIILILVTYYNK